LLLKRIGAKNYFVALFVLLGITILLVVSAFIITAFFPGSTGRIPYTYKVESASEFEPWAFQIKNLEVNFPMGGIILNLNQTDRYRSDLLLGEVAFDYNGEPVDPQLTGGLFMVTEHGFFEEVRGNNIFMPVEDETLLAHVTAIAEGQKGLPAIWKDTIPMIFHAREDLVYYYLVSPEGEPHLPPAANYSMQTLFGAFLFYIIFFLIIGMVLTILSPDHQYSRYWFHLGKTIPGLFSLVLIPVAAAIMTVSSIAISLVDLSEFYATIGYALALMMLILSAKKGKIDYLDLGLRRDKIKNGYLLALTAAALIIFVIRGLPAGADLSRFQILIQLPLLFLILALPREMIWRGYIQAFLSRRLGVTNGLAAMVLLTAITHFIILVITDPWMVSYPYTYLETAVLVPGTAAILGYLYLRTENILACALLHSLLLWLPGVLHY